MIVCSTKWTFYHYQVYSQSAIWLTDFENHRTATSHEGSCDDECNELSFTSLSHSPNLSIIIALLDSLILKIYLFDFVNFYSALFYIMLFKQKVSTYFL